MKFAFKRCECVEICGSIGCGGDIIIGNGLFSQQIQKINPKDFFGEFFEIIKNQNLFVANLEGVFTSLQERREKNLPAVFSIRSLPKVANFFSRIGNFAFTVSNNHIFDYGLGGFEETVSVLKDNGIPAIGLSHHERVPFAIKLGSYKVSFLSLSDMFPKELDGKQSPSLITYLDEMTLREEMRRAKAVSDFVIVFIHTIQNHLSKYSFLPDEKQKFFSRKAIEFGADLVVGQQPHGSQLPETYQGKLIFYSLGVFMYDPRIPTIFSKEDVLYEATQIAGGALLFLDFCSHGLNRLRLQMIKNTLKNSQEIILTRDSSYIARFRDIVSLAAIHL